MEITPGKTYGFFTDTSVCIGCKACEVACKTWNGLDSYDQFFGDGYDNSAELNDQNWRYVQFHDDVPDAPTSQGNGGSWLMMSDVCKHCTHASCMEVCPTGAIIRTEFNSVHIQPDVCNGCRSCIAACPYDVIGVNQIPNNFGTTGIAQKCTLCYDRLQSNMQPACAQACPTESIQFGELSELRARAQQRLEDLHGQGVTQAQLYGHDEEIYGGLNAFFLLMDSPEKYRLPNAANANMPSRNNTGGYLGALSAAVLGLLGALVAFRRRRENEGEDLEPVAAAGVDTRTGTDAPDDGEER
jgi:formate dehydrogenase iron-sulfur subunit